MTAEEIDAGQMRKGEWENCWGFATRICGGSEILEPEWLVGVGNFAEERGKLFSDDFQSQGRRITSSSGNPKPTKAIGAKGAQQLVELGVWK